MKGALDVHRELLARDVPHEVVRLPRPVVSADDLPAALGLEPSVCVALRCYVAGTRMAVVMVRAGATPEPSALLDALGADTLRAATAAEVNAATDYAAGLVSPICLPDDVELLADSALGGADVLYTAAGEGGVALAIRTRDLLVTTGARVATLTAGPLAPAERSGWDGFSVDLPVIDLDRGTVDHRRAAAVPPAQRPPSQRSSR
ncbi:MAG: hypothetical protein JWN57_223 [Frankiales bacterium]|jgi:Cys-tRNA(Pro)/Cys-tRNA(Cys) deacylase|nr:hypothetical protein [Frankiales bacterium]